MDDQATKNSNVYYHLTSRCVSQSLNQTQQLAPILNQQRWSRWFENRVFQLANIFAIDIYSYAILNEHYHLIVGLNPQITDSWSDLQVAQKWLRIIPEQSVKEKKNSHQKFRLQAILSAPRLIKKYRKRLGNINWLLRKINEPLIKLINDEYKQESAFFEFRTKSHQLFDETELLMNMVYLDLSKTDKALSNSPEEKRETIVDATRKRLADRPLSINRTDYALLVKWTQDTLWNNRRNAPPATIQQILLKLNFSVEDWIQPVMLQIEHYLPPVSYLDNIKTRTTHFRQQCLKGVKSIRRFCISEPKI